jgi:hypothetical protein
MNVCVAERNIVLQCNCEDIRQHNTYIQVTYFIYVYIYIASCFGRRSNLQAFSEFIICFLLNLYIGQHLHSDSRQNK